MPFHVLQEVQGSVCVDPWSQSPRKRHETLYRTQTGKNSPQTMVGNTRNGAFFMYPKFHQREVVGSCSPMIQKQSCKIRGYEHRGCKTSELDCPTEHRGKSDCSQKVGEGRSFSPQLRQALRGAWKAGLMAQAPASRGPGRREQKMKWRKHFRDTLEYLRTGLR